MCFLLTAFYQLGDKIGPRERSLFGLASWLYRLILSPIFTPQHRNRCSQGIFQIRACSPQSVHNCIVYFQRELLLLAGRMPLCHWPGVWRCITTLICLFLWHLQLNNYPSKVEQGVWVFAFALLCDDNPDCAIERKHRDRRSHRSGNGARKQAKLSVALSLAPPDRSILTTGSQALKTLLIIYNQMGGIEKEQLSKTVIYTQSFR